MNAAIKKHVVAETDERRGKQHETANCVPCNQQPHWETLNQDSEKSKIKFTTLEVLKPWFPAGTFPESSKAPLPGYLLLYVAGTETTTSIAARYGISIGAITYGAKRAGLPLRGRGCRPLVEPKREQKKILSLIGTMTYEQIGRRYGVSKQRIGQLVNRWREWMKTETAQRPAQTFLTSTTN